MHTGLLAGLFEFPAIDLPASSDDSTPSSRRAQLHTLLSSLLSSPLPPLKLSSSPSPTSLSIASTADLGAITQVYSHQTRLYHILHVVLSSPTPPTLNPKSSPTPDKSLHSLAGRGNWVDEKDVASSNVGGAVGKVWAIRQSGQAGQGKLSGKPRGVAGGKPPVTKGKRAKVEEKRTREDDEFIAGSDEEIEVERSVRRKKRVSFVEVEKGDSPPPSPPIPAFVPRKKPRIVVSDDEDEN